MRGWEWRCIAMIFGFSTNKLRNINHRLSAILYVSKDACRKALFSAIFFHWSQQESPVMIPLRQYDDLECHLYWCKPTSQ
mmetsp:Transcript_44033/g.70751  ORF Transcript_44033/g.70751 Transcript_44033/m.70751 type:complete len:80 (+) Transcript_44033:92-331(+)